MDTSGKTVLVAGGTSGIGLGLALRLQAAGSTVVVAGRRQEELDRIAREHPGTGTAVLDVTDPASIAACAADVTGRYPELDVLVAMAGIMLPEDLLDPAHLATAERTVTTNLLGPMRLAAAFLPHLLERPSAAVVTVSSGLAFVPLPATPSYSATKAAIHSWTQSLRVQLAGTSVEVLELVPPAVRTSLMGQDAAGAGMPLEDYLDGVMAILRDQPDAAEVRVPEVEFLRWAEVRGTHDEVLAQLSSRSH
jgi:short-subunit dehydrogenase involved in D-alanine esterification of teichoic acids